MKKGPLRHELQAAIHHMDRSLRMGWTHRKDTTSIRNSMGEAQTWLNRNPAATDERVREWCLANHRHVGNIVGGGSYRRLERLLNEALGDKSGRREAA